MARAAPGERSPSPQAEGAQASGATFEELLRRLELVVTRLERGELSLEDSLAAYEEGIGLVRAAQGRLDGMDQRLEQLLADGRTVPLVAAGAGRRAAAPARGAHGEGGGGAGAADEDASGEDGDDEDGDDEDGDDEEDGDAP